MVLMDSLLEVVDVDAVGFWLDPRERGVESLGTSFDGVDERDVEASSNVESLKRQSWEVENSEHFRRISDLRFLCARLCGFLFVRGILQFLLDVLLQLHIGLVVFQDATFAHPFIPVFAPSSIVNIIFNRAIFQLRFEEFRLVNQLPVVAQDFFACKNTKYRQNVNKTFKLSMENLFPALNWRFPGRY